MPLSRLLRQHPSTLISAKKTSLSRLRPRLGQEVSSHFRYFLLNGANDMEAPFNVTFDLTDEKKPTCKGECTSCCSSGQRKSTCPCGETCQCKPTCQCKHGGLIKRSEDGAVEVVEECEDCLIKFDHLRQDPVTNFGNSVPTSTEAEFLKETFTEDVLAQLDDAEDFISDPTLRKPVMPSPIDLKNLSSLANSSARLDGLGKNSSSKSKELDMEIGAATLSSSAVMKMIPSVCTLMMTVLVAFGY